jgi:hypothetical protein
MASPDWADILINSLNSAVDTKIEDQRFNKRFSMQEASKDKDKKESQAFQLRLLDISRDQQMATADAAQKRADESWLKQFNTTQTAQKDRDLSITEEKLKDNYTDVSTLSDAIRQKLGKDQLSGAKIEESYYDRYGADVLQKRGLDDKAKFAKNDRIKAIERLLEREEMVSAQNKKVGDLIAKTDEATRVAGDISKLLMSSAPQTTSDLDTLRSIMARNNGILPVDGKIKEKTYQTRFAPSSSSEFYGMTLSQEPGPDKEVTLSSSDQALVKRTVKNSEYMSTKLKNLSAAASLYQEKLSMGIPVDPSVRDALGAQFDAIAPILDNDPMFSGDMWKTHTAQVRGMIDGLRSEAAIKRDQRVHDTALMKYQATMAEGMARRTLMQQSQDQDFNPNPYLQQ